jgi:hypothetical protein
MDRQSQIQVKALRPSGSGEGEWLGLGHDEGRSSLAIRSVMCGTSDLELRNSSEHIWSASVSISRPAVRGSVSGPCNPNLIELYAND